MDKKTILRVFGEAFLRSLIVLMAILIIGFAVFFFIRINSDQSQTVENPVSQETAGGDGDMQMAMEGDADIEEPDTTEEPTTEEPTTEEPTTEEITTEELTTEEPTTEELVISSTDKKILVLNSTRISGLAKAWMNKLSGAGFTNMATGNYSASHEAQTRIYVAEEGMGQDLVGYFTDATVQVGALSTGIDVSTSGVEIFIVIGSNDTTVQ